MRTKRRCSQERSNTYKGKCGPYCANPDCKTPNDGLQIHHIIPIQAGGEDIPENMIQLCEPCHRRKDLHSNWKAHFDELLIWKMSADSYMMIAVCPLKITEVEESYDMPDADWIASPSKRHVFDYTYAEKYRARSGYRGEQIFLAGGIWNRKKIK